MARAAKRLGRLIGGRLEDVLPLRIDKQQPGVCGAVRQHYDTSTLLRFVAVG